MVLFREDLLIPENIVSNMIDFLLMDLIVPFFYLLRKKKTLTDDKAHRISQGELRRREKAE